MRFPFSIAVPALRSWFAELNYGIRTGDFCPLCDFPMIGFAALAYLGRSCFYHRYQPQRRQTFLDGADPAETCNCPHCRHNRSRGQAA